jgi:tRNA threonylcarbamoyl adenosine modification protein (Sua5/YciO/YrdC/YwlC family)
VRLRQLKPRHNFTLACRDLKHIGHYARVDDAAFRLMRAHVPGAYTFILPASTLVPKRVVTEKRRSIGVRVPDHRVAQALIETLGEPILSSSLLLPSQDLHGMEVDELAEALDQHVDVFIDAGHCGIDPTTVVSMIDQPYEVLALRQRPCGLGMNAKRSGTSERRERDCTTGGNPVRGGPRRAVLRTAQGPVHPAGRARGHPRGLRRVRSTCCCT